MSIIYSEFGSYKAMGEYFMSGKDFLFTSQLIVIFPILLIYYTPYKIYLINAQNTNFFCPVKRKIFSLNL